MRKSDVILVEAGGNVGYHVMRSLRRRGLSVAVCDVRPDGITFHSRFTRGRRCLIAPPIKHEGAYIATLHSLVEQTGASVIIPIFHPEVLARHKDEFPGVTIPLADSEVIELLDDKKRACSLAAALGIPQPGMYMSPSEVKSYPVVFKRVKGQGGDSVYFPANEKALSNLVAKSRQGSYLIMDFIEGYDVCVDAIRTGDFFAASAYRVHFPSSKGVSILRESISVPVLEDYARKMMEASGYEGICGFDFRFSTKDEKFYFLECNPRFSGGLPSAIASGLDLPSLLLDHTPSAGAPAPRAARTASAGAHAPRTGFGHLANADVHTSHDDHMASAGAHAPRIGVVTKSYRAARLWRRKFPSSPLPSLPVDRYDDLPITDLPALLFTLLYR